ILLTPHLTAPRSEPELDILRDGAYNLGFIAVRRDADAFLKWWQARVSEHGRVDRSKGLVVDQRWIDLVPGMFPGVHIVRDPGYTLAYWNLDSWNGGPLYFFHFSGFDPANPKELSRYRDLKASPNVLALAREYSNELLAHGYEQCRQWPCAYGRPSGK